MKTRTVFYGERQYRVPAWTSYMATDKGGDIYAYSHKPHFNGVAWGSAGKCIHIAHRELNDSYFAGQSLMHYRRKPLPHFVRIPLKDVCLGDVVTLRVSWHVSGWCPLVRLDASTDAYLIGEDDRGVRRKIGKSHLYLWKRVND